MYRLYVKSIFAWGPVLDTVLALSCGAVRDCLELHSLHTMSNLSIIHVNIILSAIRYQIEILTENFMSCPACQTHPLHV